MFVFYARAYPSISRYQPNIRLGVKCLIAQHTLAYNSKVFLQVCNLHFYTRKSNVCILWQSLPHGQHLVFVP
jgi:hypothetical protein